MPEEKLDYTDTKNWSDPKAKLPTPYVVVWIIVEGLASYRHGWYAENQWKLGDRWYIEGTKDEPLKVLFWTNLQNLPQPPEITPFIP